MNKIGRFKKKYCSDKWLEENIALNKWLEDLKKNIALIKYHNITFQSGLFNNASFTIIKD